MSHHPASFTHPSKNTEASNIYHETAPPLGVGTKRSHKGSEASHGGETGFDLTCHALFSPLYLNVKSGDCYVDAGGGRGNTVIACKLVNPNVRAVSVEIDEERHEMAIQWNMRIEKRVPWESSGPPEFILKSFLDENLVDDLWKKPGLKIYFNNFNMKMMSISSRDEVGVQFQLENRLTKYCRPDTVIVSLEKMFMGDNCWSEEFFYQVLGSTDLDWLSSSQKIWIYKYTRKSNADEMRKRRRAAKEPLDGGYGGYGGGYGYALGAAVLDDSAWEEEYGKQTYPATWNSNGGIRFMVDEPYKSSASGKNSEFEPNVTDSTKSTRVLTIYKDGVFSASSFIRNVYYVFPTVEKNKQEDFLMRWLYFFNEISLQSHGSAEHLKQSCSYVRPGRYLVAALTALESKAVYEFGAGKGVLFSLLEMMRELRGFPVTCDFAVESERKVKQWSKFDTSDNLQLLKELGVVQYEAKEAESHTTQHFKRRFEEWRRRVARMNEEDYRGLEDLTPEILLIVWPNTDDEEFVNCVRGWHAAGGERIAVIYDPKDKEASVQGPFLTEVPGRKWRLMKNVLHDLEGGVKNFDGHMKLMPWGFSSQEIYQDGLHSYGLYIYQRK